MKVSLVERIEDAARGLEESGGDRITWGEVEGVLREIGWKDDREGEEKWEWEEEEGRGGRTRGAKERVGEKRRVEIALGLVERLLAGNKVRDGILEVSLFFSGDGGCGRGKVLMILGLMMIGVRERKRIVKRFLSRED